MQLEATKEILKTTKKLDLRVSAVSCMRGDQSWMLLSEKGISLAEYEAALKDKSKGEVGTRTAPL